MSQGPLYSRLSSKCHVLRQRVKGSALLLVSLPACLVYLFFVAIGWTVPAVVFAFITMVGAGYSYWTSLRLIRTGVTATEEGPYARAWQDYKAVCRRAGAAILLFVSLPTSVTYVSDLIFGTTTPVLVVGIVTMAGAAFSYWQLITWRCPRCDEVFGPYGVPPFNRRCRHCGLPKWASGPEETQSSVEH